ncbi:MAG TPA: VOC family protein, partial [Gemmatimonadales bacterium]|nr:VOC family protein [Gemmatimonadales bacterium]
VGDAQQDLDFYARVLGLRLVKQTVNFDNHHVFHFYYGDERGTPGTIMTTFPYKGYRVPIGLKGAGQINTTSFSVPPGSFPAWRDRFAAAGVPVTAEGIRFGEPFLGVSDPSGLELELVESVDARAPWAATVPADMAIRGVHSVTLTVRSGETSVAFLAGVLGWTAGPTEGRRIRMNAGTGGAGKTIDILHAPEAPQSLNGLGTVHHVAMAIATPEEQLLMRDFLLQLGARVTEVRDRQYFLSIYFREPGGVLYEIATMKPGFAVDETLPDLGKALKLPPWEEPYRNEIEAGLPSVTRPGA